MNPLVLLAVIGGVFAVVFLYGFFARRPDPVAALRREYLALMRLGRAAGEAHLAERLESVAQKMPGHTNEWYLRWLVEDLRRAKRG